jgi:Skp family chaperone for outer membrane proteins
MSGENMKNTSKIISIILISIMLTSVFAGAAPVIVDRELNTNFTEQSGEKTNLKLIHRSIDYDAKPLSPSYIVPSYESQDNQPSDSDLDFYFATDTTKDILDSAEKNKHDPALIYSFVHNYFEYVPYFGSLKGAHLTYMDRKGNDADLASLTISLLRASDIPARYVYGTIELDTEQAKNYFGMENESAIEDMLLKNGISARTVSDGIQFDHIWVEAYVDGNWIQFDPSFKQYNYTSGIDLMNLAQDSDNYNSILQDNIETSGDNVTGIDISGINNSFSIMSDNFSSLINTKYANKSNSEIFGTKQIIPHTDYYTIPEELPYKTIGVHGEYADLPDDFNHKLGINFTGIDIVLNTTEVAGKRISVFYEPSNEDDRTYFNSTDNLSELNALKINMSALLRVDGTLKAVGEPETLGSEQKLEISFIAPGGQTDSYTRTLQTGAYFVIGLALQPVSTAHMSERVERYEVTSELLDMDYFNVTKDELYGEFLNLQALTFWGKYGLYNNIAAKATDVVYTRHPSVILVGTEFDITEADDNRSVKMNGVYTDIVRDIINPAAKDGDSAKSYAFLFTRGMTASSMEQSMLSLSYNVTAYSTSEIIREAGDQGIPILTLNDSNWADKNSSLSISDDQKTIVENAVKSGYTVIVPSEEVEVGNFTGSVFIVFDPATGASSYYGPDGKGWGWLDTLKTGLEAGVSAAGSVVKGTAKVIADTGGKIAGVATGVISTVGEAVNGTGSTIARVAKTAVTGAVNAAGYVVTTVVPTAAAGVTAATTAGLVVVTAFTADRVTELGKTVIDIYDAKADYEKSMTEYKETQEKIQDKKEQIRKEDLEAKREELKEKKEEIEEKKEKVEKEEEIELDKEKEEDSEETESEETDEEEFPGDDEKPKEEELPEKLDLDEIPDPEDEPLEPSSPGGDHPDDTFSVASSKLRNSDITSLQIRNAYKKGYTTPVRLNEYKLGQLDMEKYRDYTNSEDLATIKNLSDSQSSIYTTIVKNYDTIEEELELASDVLMLQKGFYASAKSMVENRGIPVQLIRVQDFTTADTEQLVHDTPVLFLPSGSLYGLDSSTLIRDKFAEYVAEGGTLFVMAQQHGYEYNILPHNGTRSVGGAGWQEDQSCLYNAASINEYHPVISGQPSPTLTVNIDGYFTSYPENSTIILKRNKNSMPAMLAYDYYNGTVIATSVYDDWAYFDGASTLQGELLVRDVLAWAEDPDNVDSVQDTDSIDIPVNITNKGDFAATKVLFNFTDPLGNTQVNNSIDLTDLEPGSSAEVNFTCDPRTDETTGIWNLDYILVNESDTIYTEYDARKVAIGKYVISDQGYSTSPDITYSIRSTNDHFAYGSDAVFTISFWNHGDTDKNVTLKYCFPHHGWIEYDPAYGINESDRSWYNLEEEIEVPAQGSASFNHKLENVRTYDRLWSNLYDSDGRFIGSSTLGFYSFNPKLEIEFDSSDTFRLNSNNTLNFTINEEAGNIYNASVDVKIYDSKSNLIDRENTISNITDDQPYNGSINFSPEKTGSYNFVVEVTKGDRRLGTNSQYILAKEKVLNIDVSEPVYRFNATNTFNISVENMEKTNFSGLEIETIYVTPDGNTAYSDTMTLDLEAESSRQLGIQIPFNETFFGRHTVSFTLLEDENILDDTEYSFDYSPKLWAHLSSSVLVKDTEEIIKVSVTNGNVPAELMLNISSPEDIGYQNFSRIILDAGERKNIEYELPVRSNVAAGAITIDLHANEKSKQGYSLITKQLTYTGGKSKLTPSLPSYAVAGSNLTFNITNEGPSGTSTDYSIYFLGTSKKGEGIEIEDNATINVEVPVPRVSSGEYNLVYDIRNMGTSRNIRQSIPVQVMGLDLNMSMEEDELRADRYIPVILNNSGIETTVDLRAQLRRGSSNSVFTKENVILDSGEEKIVEIPLSPSLPSGAYALSLSYENSSYDLSGEREYSTKINGLDLDFNVTEKEYVTGESLDLVIENVGKLDAVSDVKIWLDNEELGTQQASTPPGKQSVLTYNIPENLPTGSYSLFVRCREENSGRILTFSKTIPVSGLEYKLELEPQTVTPTKNLTANISNTGAIPLSGDYELRIMDNGNQIKNSTGTISSVGIGETKKLSLEVPTLTSGTYTFTFEFTDQLGREESRTVHAYIPDPSFELTLNPNEYSQNDSIGVSLNITNIGNGSFTMTLFDAQNNTISSATEEKDASNGSVDLAFEIPEGIMSGNYILFVDVKDKVTGLSNSTSASFAVEGMTITPQIRTDRTKYLEDDNITYDVRLNYTSVPEGNASIKAYLQEGVSSSDEFTLQSKYPVTAVERLGDTLFVGTNGGLYKETGFAEIQAVDNSNLATMKISGLYVDGNLLWILSDNTVYRYDPVSDMLVEVLVVEKQDEEQHNGEGGGNLFAVDSSNQVIYMPNGWDGVIAYSYDGSKDVTYYNSGNSPISGQVTNILVLPGEVLFVDYNRCYSLSDGGLEVYDSSDGLLSVDVYSVVADDTNLYFITNTSISRRDVSGGTISTEYEFQAGESFTQIDTATVFDGEIYFTSGTDLYRYDSATETFDNFTLFDEYGWVSDLEIENSTPWFCSYGSLYASDKTEIESAVEVPIPETFSLNGMITGDSSSIVSVDGKSVSIYDISSQAWTEMEVPVESGIDDVTLTADHIWIADGANLIGIDRNTKEISIFNESNSDYKESGVSLIEGHNEDMWILGSGGVSVYSVSDGLRTSDISIPDISDPQDITSFEDIVAVIDSSGTIYEYNYMSDNVLTYGTGLTNVREFEYNQNIYWIVYQTYELELYSYNPENPENSGPEESMENTHELATAGETLYSLSLSDISSDRDWLYIFDGENWNEYSGDLIPDDKWISGMESSNSNILVYGEGWITSLSGQGKQLVMNETVNLADLDDEGTYLSWQGKYLSDNQGQLTFELEAVTDYNQITDTDRVSVDVYEKDVSVALSTAKEYYRTDETINANVLVSNNAPALFEKDLVLLIDGNEVEVDRSDLSIASAENSRLEVEISDLITGNHTISARVGDTVVTRDIIVQDPVIQVSMNAPDIVNHEPFTVELFANNSGNVEARTDVKIKNLVLDEDEFGFVLPPGTSRSVEFNATIDTNTTIIANFTGDNSGDLTKDVEFGERVDIDCQCQPIYRAGTAEIPVNITNTGEYNSDFNITFSVNTTTQTNRSYLLGINQSIEDVLVFDLAEGDYTLNASGEIPVVFEEVSFSASELVDFETGELDIVSGNLTFLVNVSNGQPQLPFNGTLSVVTDFYEDTEKINLSAMENISTSYEIPLPESAGNYTLNVSLIENEKVINFTNSTFNIELPQFNVVPASSNKQRVQPAETVTYNFTVSNTGSVGGMTDMYLDTPGIYEESMAYWIPSGEKHNFSFSFKAPDDLPEGNYRMYYGLEENELNESSFYLEGANVTVTSWLDRRSYLPGENATLTMQVSNNGNHTLDLYSRVKYVDFEDIHDFTVDGGNNSTFSVDIPISETDKKVFISVYLNAPEGGEDSGRSLYINSDYIHDKRDINGLRITTEKQAYEAGETVAMNVNVTRADHLTIVGPGLDYDDDITGNTTIEFEVPNIMSGMYSYDITYGNTSGEYLLDIHGFNLIVKAAEIEMEKEDE